MIVFILIYIVSVVVAWFSVEEMHSPSYALVFTPVVNTIFALVCLFTDDSDIWKY